MAHAPTRIGRQIRDEMAKKPLITVTAIKEDGEVFGRGFDYTYIRKFVGKVRTEIVVEIDRAQIEPRLAARTIQQSSGKAEFRKWIGSWFEKRQRRVARRFYFLRDFLFVKVKLTVDGCQHGVYQLFPDQGVGSRPSG